MTDVILADAEAERQRAANGRPHQNTMQALARVPSSRSRWIAGRIPAPAQRPAVRSPAASQSISWGKEVSTGLRTVRFDLISHPRHGRWPGQGRCTPKPCLL